MPLQWRLVGLGKGALLSGGASGCWRELSRTDATGHLSRARMRTGGAGGVMGRCGHSAGASGGICRADMGCLAPRLSRPSGPDIKRTYAPYPAPPRNARTQTQTRPRISPRARSSRLGSLAIKARREGRQHQCYPRVFHAAPILPEPARDSPFLSRPAPRSIP